MWSYKVIVMGLIATLLGCAKPKLVVRPLGDYAVIEVGDNSKVKDRIWLEENEKAILFRMDEVYPWAFSGVASYRQQLWVRLAAADAVQSIWPGHLDGADGKRPVEVYHKGPLRVLEGRVRKEADFEAARRFEWDEPENKLRIVWHCWSKLCALEEGLERMQRMASSFRLKRDWQERILAIRDLPRLAKIENAKKLALTLELLNKRGYQGMKPGVAVERDGVYAEWMLEPEARIQFVKFLGLRKSVDPKPQLRISEKCYPLTAGWRLEDGSYTNVDNAYLPMPGITELLNRVPRDAGPILYYAVLTIRIDEAQAKDIRFEVWDEKIAKLEAAFRDGSLFREPQ